MGPRIAPFPEQEVPVKNDGVIKKAQMTEGARDEFFQQDGNVRNQEVVSHLQSVAMNTYSSNEQQLGAIQSLVELGPDSPGVVASLMKIATTYRTFPDGPNRAKEELRNMKAGVRSGLPEIVDTAMNHQSGGERLFAVELLGNIGRNQGADKREIMDVLQLLRSDRDKDVRALANEIIDDMKAGRREPLGGGNITML